MLSAPSKSGQLIWHTNHLIEVYCTSTSGVYNIKTEYLNDNKHVLYTCDIGMVLYRYLMYNYTFQYKQLKKSSLHDCINFHNFQLNTATLVLKGIIIESVF